MTRFEIPERKMREAWRLRNDRAINPQWREYYRSVLRIGFQLIRENRENS
jgi:hypothetical protein